MTSSIAVQTQLVKYEAACQALAAARSTDEVQAIRNAAEAMRAYARQAKNRALEADAAAIRLRAERRLGQLIAEQKRTVGMATGGTHGGRPTKLGARREPSLDAPPTLADAGISKKLSVKSQRLADLKDDEFEEKLDLLRQRAEEEDERIGTDLFRATSVAHISRNTGLSEWYTPPEIVTLARRIMGSIDLDPASSDVANEQVKAERYYTAEDDGLSREWSGTVWMNPPYSQPLVTQFCQKLADEYRAGNVTQACVLVNNATETGWFRCLAEVASVVCFPDGRIRFWSPNVETSAPLQGQALFYCGQRVKTFVQVVSGLGIAWVKP